MKQSDLISVGVGVAVVVLAYAAYGMLKRPATAGGGAPQLGAVNPGSVGFQPANPGQYLSTDELIYGAATSGPYDTYVFTDDLASNLTGGKPRSIMGDISGWWNGNG